MQQRSVQRRRILLFSFFSFLVVAIVSLFSINNTVTNNISTSTNKNLIIASAPKPSHKSLLTPPPSPPPPPAVISFECPIQINTSAYTCQSHPPSLPKAHHDSPSSTSCPDYFRWIHEDLRPWKSKGITKQLVERAKRTANFRLVIVNGRAYVETYQKSFQSRDEFTLWGILQLLRRYPGQVPDLDLMFDCVDWPVMWKKFFKSTPPPLFRYCSNDSMHDIVFPDWSFWGWPEINIKPWDGLLNDLKEGNKKIRWTDREPYAYWKGNPAVAPTRQDLLKCNVSEGQEWNARLYAQDWFNEIKEGFKGSNLAEQCNYRYKIYIEGSAWSVSEKYILACDSLSLIVNPHYYDFYTRGLMPVHHYWPIRENNKCRSIKFAVDWGNSHKQKAQAIGKEASSFIQEKLSMDYIYDYMFHLLSEYAKLLRYKPTVPVNAIELCTESMVCPATGLERKFMMESMVKTPHASKPCALPPPYSPGELRVLKRRKENSMKQVEMWEEKAQDVKYQ